MLLGAIVVLLVSAWAARGAATTIGFTQKVEASERPAVLELLHRFETETGIRVEMVDLGPEERVADRLAADRREGRHQIGVFAEDNVNLLPLVQQHLVEELSELPVAGVDVPLVASPEGKRYFLPFRPNVQIAFVSKEALRKTGAALPTSFQGLLEVARAFRKETGQGKVTLSLAPGDPGAVTVAELIRSFGGDPLTLDDKGSVNAFEFLQDMRREGLLAEQSFRARFDTQLAYLGNQTSWLAQTWPFTSTVLARRRQLDGFEVSPGWSTAHVIGGDVLGIPRGLPEREERAARALAEFLISRDSQRFLAKENAWPSIREDAYTGIWWGGCGGFRCPPWVAARQIEHADTLEAARKALQQGPWLRPNTERWQLVTCAMTTAVSRIVQGGQDAGAVLAELRRSVDLETACPQRSP